MYCIRNKVNNKLYIGWSSNPKTRWTKEIYRAFTLSKSNEKEYNSPLSRAFRKYGKNKEEVKNFFDFFVLEEFDNKIDSLEAEEFWIQYLRTDISRYGSDRGYNRCSGGSGGILGYKFTKEQKQKLSLKKIGELNSSSKLDWNKVKNIRFKYNLGKSASNLAKEYGVHRTTIFKIISKITWNEEKS